MKQSPDSAKYNKGILPQMAKDEPSYCEKLLNSEFDRFIIVDKAKMKLFLYDKFGVIEKSYGIACAKNYGTKNNKGDSRTSDGFFSAEGIYDSTEWLFTNDAGYTSPVKGQFGPRFIRLQIPNTRAIGIHGTSAPGSIGRRCSHGCIRLTNDNILDLVKYAEVGMPIIVSPGPYDIAINESEGHFIPAVATEPGDVRAVKGPLIKQREPSISTPAASDEETSETDKILEESETPAAPTGPSTAPEEQKATQEQIPAAEPATPTPAAENV